MKTIPAVLLLCLLQNTLSRVLAKKKAHHHQRFLQKSQAKTKECHDIDQMAKDIVVLKEGMSTMKDNLSGKINILTTNVKQLNEKIYEQDDLLKSKLAELEKVESDLTHLHEDM